MDLPISLQDITYAENYLAQGDLATATPLLERLVELAEEYIDAECKTEENRQYFSFDSKFERSGLPPRGKGSARAGAGRGAL